jgi:hypothetical protein
MNIRRIIRRIFRSIMICRECWLITLNTTVSICQQSEHVMNYHDTLLAPSYPTQSLLQAHLTSHTRIAKKQMSMLHSIPFPNYPTSIRILLLFTSPTSKKNIGPLTAHSPIPPLKKQRQDIIEIHLVNILPNPRGRKNTAR